MLRNNAQWNSQFRDKLLTLTVVPLKRFYRVLIGFTDGTGRLPGERSGEAPQSGGMSEIEQLFNTIVSGIIDETDSGPERDSAPIPFLDDEPKKSKKDFLVKGTAEEIEDWLERAIETVSNQWWGDEDDDRHRVSEDG